MLPSELGPLPTRPTSKSSCSCRSKQQNAGESAGLSAMLGPPLLPTRPTPSPTRASSAGPGRHRLSFAAHSHTHTHTHTCARARVRFLQAHSSS